MVRAIGNLKECCRCRETKSTTEFNRKSRNLDGSEYHCKACSKIEADGKREHLRELDRKHYYKHRKRRIAKSSKHNYQKRGKELPEKWVKHLAKPRVSMSHEEAVEHERVRMRNYKRANKELMREKYKEYSQTERGREVNRLRAIRRRARIANLPCSLTQVEIEFLLYFQTKKCACCDKIFTDKLKYELDHVIPVLRGGALDIHNIQLLCRSCNASKGTKTIRYIPPIPKNLNSFVEGR